jgi:glycosyltransferase domain-containing protein
MKLDLTIIVPTFNRTYFLKKLLNYYDRFKFSGEILILDSSEGEIKKNNKKLCRLKESLNIKYISVKGHPLEVMKKCINFAKSSFVVYSGDDDYFVVPALNTIVFYLKQKNIGLCCGEAVLLYKKKNKFIGTHEYASLHSRLEKTAFDRTLANMKNYSVALYFISRKDLMKKSLMNVNRTLCPSRNINDELIVTMGLICFAKAKKIKMPYLIRQIGHNRTSYPLESFFTEQGKHEQNISLNYLINTLLKIIKKVDKKIKKSYKEKLTIEYKKIFNKNIKQNFLMQLTRKILSFHRSNFYFQLKKIFIFKFLDKFDHNFDKFNYDNIIRNKLYYHDLLVAINFLKKKD